MNKLKNKKTNDLKYCYITNDIKKIKNKKTMNNSGINQWVNVFKGEMTYSKDVLPDLEDGKFDLIHVDINNDDIELINIIRDKIGNDKNNIFGERAFTKIIASFDSKIEMLENIYKHPKFYESLSNADFIFCVHHETSKKMSELLMRKIYTINHPPIDFFSNSEDNNNETLIEKNNDNKYRKYWEKYKEQLMNYIFEELDNERFRYQSIWKKLNLCFYPEISDELNILNSNQALYILGCNTYHDGGTALIYDGNLICSIESEKDSNWRHSHFNDLEASLKKIIKNNIKPDIITLIGEYKYHPYFTTDKSLIRNNVRNILGENYIIFQTSHERAHIFSTFGMSPFKQGKPFYALTYEGGIGRLYYVDENMRIEKLDLDFWFPGFKYTLPYTIADNKSGPLYLRNFFGSFGAGKTMALTGFANEQSKKDKALWKNEIETLLGFDRLFYRKLKEFDKSLFKLFKKMPFYNKGVESQLLKDFVWKYQNAIFERFYDIAKKNIKYKLPLVISGGCGLNCEWNRKWKDSGLFEDVFVTPCANDSGIAIGAAIDAQYYFTKNAKINWNVYSGEIFIMDEAELSSFEIYDLDYSHLVKFLLESDNVIAWVQGKYEIGPRALCHRSLIASPFKKSILRKLNVIKKREQYRPIAPICLEEDIDKYFDWKGPSPYMLYFQKVLNDDLEAITHVDKTARVQTVSKEHNERMYQLLKLLKMETGYSVLCNTSLNFPGKGFINRMSDLVDYVLDRDIDAIVVEDKFYIRKK